MVVVYLLHKAYKVKCALNYNPNFKDIQGILILLIQGIACVLKAEEGKNFKITLLIINMWKLDIY